MYLTKILTQPDAQLRKVKRTLSIPSDKLSVDRIRKVGGGRKKVIDLQPEILQEIDISAYNPKELVNSESF